MTSTQEKKKSKLSWAEGLGRKSKDETNWQRGGEGEEKETQVKEGQEASGLKCLMQIWFSTNMKITVVTPTIIIIIKASVLLLLQFSELHLMTNQESKSQQPTASAQTEDSELLSGGKCSHVTPAEHCLSRDNFQRLFSLWGRTRRQLLSKELCPQDDRLFLFLLCLLLMFSVGLFMNRLCNLNVGM